MEPALRLPAATLGPVAPPLVLPLSECGVARWWLPRGVALVGLALLGGELRLALPCVLAACDDTSDDALVGPVCAAGAVGALATAAAALAGGTAASGMAATASWLRLATTAAAGLGMAVATALATPARISRNSTRLICRVGVVGDAS